MSSEWSRLQIKDLGRIVTGKTPSTSRPDYFDGDIPFLTPTDMTDGVKVVSTSRSLTQSGLSTIKNCLVPKGVAVSCIGWQMGKTVLVLEPTVTNQQINTVVVDESRFDLHFTYYLLSSMREKIFQFGATATRTPIINKSSFGELSIVVPSLREQTQIASLLTGIDERIALLRETNATLEAIAQALFKSWFVDFDPVHANAGTQAPSLPPEIQALFPATFTDSPQGPIPEGWQVMPFGDFIERMSVGKKFDQKSALEEGSIPILDQGRSGIIGFHNETPGVKASLEEPVVVFANHTCYMRLITFDFSAIQNVLPFIGKGVDTVWAFYATKDRIQFSEYKGHWPDFAIEKSVVPPKTLTELYRSNIDSIIRSTRNNELQIEALSKLRDTLLPRLISGQLRLSEATQELSEVL